MGLQNRLRIQAVEQHGGLASFIRDYYADTIIRGEHRVLVRRIK
jgi:sulfur relay (sulfurtransferase) DsrC/TusE family protein